MAWAALITGGFMMVEVVGGLFAGSLALIADAGHMLSDFASLLLAWIGFRIARRPADVRRTFGFSRFSVLAAFVNGLALFAIAGWIVYEAVMRLNAPRDVLAGTMLWVAAGGFVANLMSFAILHGADRDNLNVRGALLHVAGDLFVLAAHARDFGAQRLDAVVQLEHAAPQYGELLVQRRDLLHQRRQLGRGLGLARTRLLVVAIDLGTQLEDGLARIVVLEQPCPRRRGGQCHHGRDGPERSRPGA